MAISQLNTLFTKHHRIIFGVFAVLIMLAFVVGDYISGGGGSMGSANGQVGEIFGEEISYNDINDQMQLDALYLSLFQNNRVSRDNMAELSFQKLAVLKMAHRAGVMVSDKEVALFIHSLFPGENGRFSVEKYQKFVAEHLTAQGFAENDFNEMIRQMLTIEKYQNIHSSSTIIAEEELVQFYNLINAELEVMVCTLPLESFAKNVKVDPAALDAFFQNNRNNYVIPAKFNALVVSFPYQQFRSDAIKNVTEDQLKSFYDQNPYLFAVVKDGQIQIPEFEEVKDQVRSSAIAAAAKDMAFNKASEFASSAYDRIVEIDAAEYANTFKAFIQERKVTALATGLFDSTASAAGTIADEALVKELAQTTDLPVSNAVAGSEAAYVGFITTYIPSRLAEFDEVKDKVTADYVNSEAMAAAQARGQEILAQLNELPAPERAAAAEKIADFPFKTLPKFTLMNSSEELGYGVMLVLDLLPGELFADVLPAQNGCQLLLLKSRTNSATPYTPDPNIEAMYQQKQMQLNMSRFQEYVNANCLMVQEEAAVGE